ncbi:hypothetical protein JKY72_05250 [Candidatus Gracilibacteria bacterium]|nr:hypothetical protein [Candidatus Gracilibacteria bacterium]
MLPKFPKILVKIFIALAAAKILLSFFILGFNLPPDEPCLLWTARNLASTFDYQPCSELRGWNAGDAPFLPVIIYSFFYALFSPVLAFKFSLFFNSVLAASLVFPLYNIFKNYIEEDRKIIPIIAALTFIPAIFIYEKSVMTEIFFSSSIIWMISFYITGLKSNSTKPKIIAFVIAALTLFVRPYGFIAMFALTANEFFLLNKKNKIISILAMVIFAGLVLLLKGGLIFSSLGASIDYASGVGFKEAGIRALGSLVTLFNSLSISTLLLPLLVLIFTKGEKVKNIRVFLLSFVVLNILVIFPRLFIDPTYQKPLAGGLTSVFGQADASLFEGKSELGALVFRYLNSSTILVLIFALITLLKGIKAKMKPLHYLQASIVIGLVYFVDIGPTQMHFVYDYAFLFDYGTSAFYMIIAFSLALIFLYQKGRSRYLLQSIFAGFFIISALSFSYNANATKISSPDNEIVNFLADKEGDILFIVPPELKWNATYWANAVYLDTKVETGFFFNETLDHTDGSLPDLYKITEIFDRVIEDFSPDYQSYGHIVTPMELSFEKVYTGKLYNIYKP